MWIKQGQIFDCDFYGTGYAQDPFVDDLGDIWRIYYSTRTKDVVSMPYYIDVEAGNPKNVLYIQKEPLLNPGYAGTFDDNGITMTSIVTVDNLKYLYYCGWNKSASVPYHLSIGVAIGDGKRFEKKFDGPVMDRFAYDPICVSAPYVVFDPAWRLFRMWYISFTSWRDYDGRKEPTFVIKTAYSEDGFNWKRVTKPCFKSKYEGESFARPCVLNENGLFKMWYSVRGPSGYRDKSGQHYMIGYAESNNGENFRREPINFPLSESGWDSEMLCYATVIKHKDTYFMFYNGNSFGKTGIGYATYKL